MKAETKTAETAETVTTAETKTIIIRISARTDGWR